MNLANKLTLSRLFMVPAFVVLMAFDNMGLSLGWQLAGHVAALAIFVAAALTDYYDGALARKHGWETNFGRLMDPLADKLIVVSAFVVLVEDQIFPAWMVVILLCREFLITGLRTLGASSQRVIAADRWGKNKTISQMVAIITALTFMVGRDALMLAGVWERWGLIGRSLAFHMNWILLLLMWVVVFFTVVSGVLYVWNQRDLIKDV